MFIWLQKNYFMIFPLVLGSQFLLGRPLSEDQMQVLALPGRRVETEAWLKKLLVAAQIPDAEVTRYRHWDTDADAAVAFEAERLSDWMPRLVIAKSFGTVVAATAHCLHQFQPAFGIFIGTPYAVLEDEEVHLLQRFSADVETLFIHQAEDPGGSAAQLSTALQLRLGEVVEVPGNDHLYLDTGALAVIVRRWEARVGWAKR